MARETQAIAQRLQMLLNNPPSMSTLILPAPQMEKTSYPPHLHNTLPLPGRTAVTSHQLQGAADPITPATGLAEPINPAEVSAAPAQTASQCGMPQPGEAIQE